MIFTNLAYFMRKYCFILLFTYPMPMETGRGNVDTKAIEKTKKFLRARYSKGIRAVELARYLKKSQPRALRILDLLSGVSNDRDKEDSEFITRNFLIYINDDSDPVTYHIFLDKEKGIYAI